MTCDSFAKSYWAHYISIEKEFIKTLSYVSLSEDNYETYSEQYLKLLLEIGSEVDITMKMYCSLIGTGFHGTKISHYLDFIINNYPDFFEHNVTVQNNSITLMPWLNTDESGNILSPFWWKAYNKVKHCRTKTGTIEGQTKEYYKFANQKYVLLALAGLYQVLLCSYYKLATQENNHVLIPLPGSRVFQISGEEWDDVSFYNDFALYINEDGELIMEQNQIFY